MSTDLFACPVAGCLVFPYDRVEDRDEHVASGDHVFTIGNRAQFAVDRSARREYDKTSSSPTSGNGSRSVNGPSEKQVSLIERLLAERSVDVAALAAVIDVDGTSRLRDESVTEFVSSLSRAQASQVIDWLMQLPAQRRTNRYPGRCVECCRTVPEGAGELVSRSGRLQVRCWPECDPLVSADSVLHDPTVEPGVWMLDGALFRVKRSNGSGRLYAQQWVGDEWVYRGIGPVSVIAERGTRLTATEAAEFGHRHGVCVFCGRGLDDERSVKVGYGPICAARYGLPWGEEN